MARNDEQKAIGRRLRRAREAAGLVQADIARHLGITPGAYNRYEQGGRQIPPGDLVRVARVLEVPPETLLADEAGAPLPPQRTPQELLRQLEAVTPVLLPRRAQTASAGNGNHVDAEYVAFWPTPEQRTHRIEPIVVAGDCLEPRLLGGHTAIVDYDAVYDVAPGRDADSAPIVLARHDGEELFKAYVQRDGERFLEALDGRPAIPIGPDTQLLGVVVEARYRLDRRRRR